LPCVYVNCTISLRKSAHANKPTSPPLSLHTENRKESYNRSPPPSTA
jgi:hypothetical protein